MAEASAYQLLLMPPGGGEGREVAALVQWVTWSGDIRQTARELSAALMVPRDGSVEPPALEEGAALAFQAQGRTVFTGQLLQCSVSSQSPLVTLSALDGGRFLAGNRGWYQFDAVLPEQAAALICADFGIPVAALAPTGVKVSRSFPGSSSLDKIISKLYSMAGEQNGKRYCLRFTGEGALEVVEKGETAALEIVRTMGVTNAWDITDLCTSVAIRREDGTVVGRMEDSASRRRNGLLEHVIIQRSGEDAQAKAAAWLEDNRLQQDLTVEVLNPPLELISGTAVALRDTGTGAEGLFWVDTDVHTWKNGQHLGKFRLNVRNVTGG